MSSTMLQLVQQAYGEMGLNVPSSVAGNQSLDVVQAQYLLNAVGNELIREPDDGWQALVQQYITTVSYTTITGNTTNGSSTLSGIASTTGIDTTYGISGAGINQACYVSAVPSGTTLTLSQPATSTNTGATYTLTKVKYAMPSDYDRQIDRTHWDKSKHWEMLGPEDAQQWQWLKSGYISTGPRVRWRILGGTFQIWPPMNTQEYLGFEYRSNAWAQSASGTPQQSLVNDTDTAFFDTRIMVIYTKLKYFQIKGFDTSSLTQDYQRYLSIAKANDKGAPNLSFNPNPSKVLIGWANIPDTGYGT